MVGTEQQLYVVVGVLLILLVLFIWITGKLFKILKFSGVSLAKLLFETGMSLVESLLYQHAAGAW